MPLPLACNAKDGFLYWAYHKKGGHGYDIRRKIENHP